MPQIYNNPLNLAKSPVFLLALAFTVNAQSGAIDLSFNPTDQGFGLGDGANSSVLTTAIQSDGKIIIGGGFTSYNGTARNHIARLNADGTLDETFVPGVGANDAVNSIAIQNDGKIIIGGYFTSYNGTSKNRIARLNADGTLDGSFNPAGTGANGAVNTTAIQSDGKIIIGGSFTTYNGTTRYYIARLNTDGTFDGTFDQFGTGASSNVSTTVLQSDGKIIIGGSFWSYNGTSINCVARLNADGTLDGGFNPGTGANSTVRTTVLESDGQIIIGGDFTTYNGTARNYIARLNTDGSLDGAFDPGTGANSFVRTTALQSDGKIIIGGWFTSYNETARNRVARLNADGTLDGTFNPGTGANNYVYTTVLESDGQIIIGGNFTACNETGRNYIARLNADGALDGTFNLGTGANSSVYATVLQSDGKILVGGTFTIYNGTGRNYIARLNADGTLDETFNPGTGANSKVDAIAIQSDGKIIIGGWFTSYNGTGRTRIARLNADGSLDNTFNPGSGASDIVSSIVILSSGKILIGGHFTTYDGTGRNYIARLNADGTLDETFNPGTGANDYVYTIAVQSSGQIIIGGRFTSFNGTSRKCIAGLYAEGTLNATFNPGTGANSPVITTAIQSDGKIIIGGLFTTYKGTAINRIARLNADGSLDGGFNPGTGANSTVRTTVLESDGQIIIGGDFTTYNGTARNYIARLNTDGSLDGTFDPGTGANNAVETTAIQSDGKIIIGGQFTSYYGIGRNRVARILNQGKESAANGSWNLDNTWVPVGVPVIGDDIIIKHTVTVDNAPLAVCNNMIINSGGVVQIDPGEALTVNGTLTNNSGIEGLIIQSNADGTGSLLHHTASVDATLQRFVTGNTSLTQNMYHQVSVPLAPVSNSVSNLFFGAYLYEFDVSANAWNCLGTPTNTPLDETRGYMIYTPEATHTYTFEGPMNAGEFTPLTVFEGAGNNLVPNPYPSAINWDAASGWTKTGIANSVYLWPAGGTQYITYVDGVVVPEATQNPGIIPAGQSFIVKAIAANPIFQMTDDVRLHHSRAFQKSGDAISQLLRIKATSNDLTDEAVVRFRELATTNADPEFDAWKFTGTEGAPQIYTLAGDSEKLAINALPVMTESSTVPLNFEMATSKTATLTFTNIESFDASTSIFLKDELTNQTINLRNQPVYEFSHNTGNAANRFKLVFGGTIGIEETENLTQDNLWIAENTLYIRTPQLAGQQGLLEVFDASGKLMMAKELVLSELTTVNLKQNGFVIAKLTTGQEVLTVKGILW